MNDTLQYKNFKISIDFFTLQDNPALLMPWMVYTIVFLVTNTDEHILYIVRYFAIEDTNPSVGNQGANQIYVCK